MLPKQYLRQLIATGVVISAIAAPTAMARPNFDPEQSLPAGPTTANTAAVSPVPSSGIAALNVAKTHGVEQRVQPAVGNIAADPSVSTQAVRAITLKAPADGFDWGDAAIGGAITASILLLVTAGGVAMRQRTKPSPS
jgi:hypothetical protein